MQVDTVHCSNCNSQILQKCLMIHEKACFKKLVQQKPQKGFFSKIFESHKKQQKQPQDMIPCTQCGESVPFSIFAIHQEQCVGHQLTKCESCKIMFPTFLFDQHLQVCAGPKYQPPANNGFFNFFKQPQPKMNIQQHQVNRKKAPQMINPLQQKVEKMIPEDQESEDEELEQLIGALARREIQNSKLSEEPLTGQQLKKLHQQKLNRNEECSICCCEMNKRKNHVRLNCTHVFHKKCIFSWLAKNPLCPMCRQHALKQ